jgi:hypothetical protein
MHKFVAKKERHEIVGKFKKEKIFYKMLQRKFYKTG